MVLCCASADTSGLLVTEGMPLITALGASDQILRAGGGVPLLLPNHSRKETIIVMLIPTVK